MNTITEELTTPSGFEALLNFQENSTLLELIAPQYILSQGSFDLARNSTPLEKQLDEWCFSLIEGLLPNETYPGRIDTYKSIASQIFFGSKIPLIEKKVKALGIQNLEIHNKLRRFEKYVKNIIAKPPQRGSSFLSRNLFNLASFTIPSPKETEIHIMTLKELKSKQLCQEIKKLTQRVYNWEKRFIAKFSQISTIDELEAAAKILTVPQVSALFIQSLSLQSILDWLPKCLNIIPYATLRGTLNSLGVDELKLISDKLRGLKEVKSKAFAVSFRNRRQEFIDTSNNYVKAIDSFNRYLRSKDNPPDQADVNSITQISDEAALDESALDHFMILAKNLTDNLKIDMETQHAFGEVKRQYAQIRKRLSREEAEKAESDGRPYGIIYRQCFLSNNLRDDDEAIEIFGAWNIFHLKDYHEVGLLAGATEAQIEAWDSVPTGCYTMGKKTLDEKKIHTIADWKRLRIFNRHMLKEYLTCH